MTGFGSMDSTAFSRSTAVAGSSAPKLPILDTVSTLTVSICVLPLVRVTRAKT